MNITELDELIKEMVYKSIEEKSVPEPYDRKSRRRMTPAQIARRDKIGKAMEKNKSTVNRLKAKHGDEWIDYLWAMATGVALKQGE